MKANKKNPAEEIELQGLVTEKVFGKGSKSQHRAIYLQTGNELYKLRQRGGNPFYDVGLQQYVGSTIIAKGILQGYVFLASSIREVEK